jgi:hypothetical protein
VSARRRFNWVMPATLKAANDLVVAADVLACKVRDNVISAIEESTAVSHKAIGNTFGAIELEPEVSAEQDFAQFVKTLLDKLRGLKEERFLYYDDLRRANTKWG